MMDSNSGLSLALTTGIATLVGGVAAWQLQKEYKKLEESKRKDLSEVVHLIQIKDIGSLLDSDNLEVQQYAEKLLKQRAMSPRYFPEILKSCLSDDKETVLKAVTSVFLLCTSTSESKVFFFYKPALHIMLKVIKNLSEGYNYKSLVARCKQDVMIEKTFFKCVGSIFHLTLNDAQIAKTLYQEKNCMRDIFMHILSDHGFHILADVKRWSTYIVHQLIQIDDKDVKATLRKWGIITKATLCLIRYLGDLLLTQLCLQILVQYLSDAVDEIVQVCQEMASLGILRHLVGLLRCEEEENIVQLSAIIIHHFCCFDIDVRNLSKIPGIIKILFTVLNSNEANIQKTVLRIFNYLCVSSSSFQKKLLSDIPLLKRLSICLASGNKEVVQGSLMLLHDLAMPGKHAAQKLISSNEEILKSLVSLAVSSSGEQAQLIAETLGFFCSCESLHSVLLKQGVINAILHFTKSADTSVQFWASALLLNLSMISDEFKEAIIRNGGLFILLEMAVSGDEVEMPDISSNATKALVILGFLDSSINVKLLSGMDASMIIDGTEYCPGKQGINIVSLEFVNFKYSKGLVLQPEKFSNYLRDNHFGSLKKWDPIFLVTQGDCTLLTDEGEVSREYEKFIPKDQREEFIKSPVWTMLVSARKTRMDFSEDNLLSHFKLSFEECVSVVLKENFTDPLIDVLLSYPPSSTLNKTDDLELIEILARHHFQRKAITTTAGFLEYLNEMVWSIVSLKIKNLQEPENAVKLSHCIGALKILHSFSIDQSCNAELVNRGVPRAILCLLVSLCKFIQNTQNHTVFSFNRQDSVPESEKRYSPDPEEDDTNLNTPFLTGNQFDYVTASNDNIFYEEDETTGRTTGRLTNDRQPKEITTRRRADSYIVRADNKSRQRSESRFFDRSTSIEAPVEDNVLASPYTPSRRGLQLEEAANHQQMRRISRSMSISLQLTKSVVGEESQEMLPGTDEVIKKLTRHAVMAVYHMIKNANNESRQKLFVMPYIIPVLFNILSCFDDSFKFQLGLPISSIIVKSGQFLSQQGARESVYGAHLTHTSAPKSIILSTNKMSISNENWFFESVKANQFVSTSLYEEADRRRVDGWYFEVVIHTKGIMQIGWANGECHFNAQKGIGVGDTSHSCGFDGTRCKVWSGPSVDVNIDNDYGLSWQIGDVLSVLLSWDGVISFWLNGKDFGAALKNVDTSKAWYPAASLSIDQQCSFIFEEARMKYKKTTFVTIDEVYQQFQNPTPGNLYQTDDVVTQTRILEKGVRPEVAYFFEVDLSHMKCISNVSIGYSTSWCVTEQIIANISIDFLKGVNDGGVLGCGLILQPSKRIILTKGTDLFWEMSLTEFLGVEKFPDERFLYLVPFVNVENVSVNVGQDCFVYEPANINKSKQKFLSFVLGLIDKEEKQ